MRRGCAVSSGASENDWHLARGDEASDVHAKAREVDGGGYSLFKIGPLLSEFPRTAGADDAHRGDTTGVQ
jgi:hypothetical protein